ncbi:helix-turn-helix transcriptional regulator [Salmonella enterica subsp. enterica serovar Infantis]
MKKETLSDRLNKAMELAGMSQGALAKASGVAQPTIWRLTSGNARGSTKIVEIANALGVNSEWLSTGIGCMKKDGTTPINASPSSNTFKIDILDLEVSAVLALSIENSWKYSARLSIRRMMPDTCSMVERLKISAS